MADITVTASSVKKTATTISEKGIAGVTITAGQALYKDATDSNKLKLADSDLSLAAAEAVGVSLHGALADQPIEYATGGDLTISTLVAGTVYVASATAGAIAPSADMDAASTWYCSVLGVSSSTSNLKLAIKASRAINA